MGSANDCYTLANSGYPVTEIGRETPHDPEPSVVSASLRHQISNSL
jgi:hypothetical protein